MTIDTHGRRVLVVEDSEVIRRVLSLILRGEGYLVDLAESGTAALTLAEELRPDAVTLDLGLPDLDGRDVLRCLKENPATSAIPIVVISAKADELSAAELAYAAQIIVKPFDVDALLNGVSRALGQPLHAPLRRRQLN